MAKFKQGDRVGLPINKYDVIHEGKDVEYHVGSIKDIVDSSFYVKWDNGTVYMNSCLYKEDQLLSEEDLFTQKNKLVEEFNLVCTSIQGKMKIAAQAIRDANAIAEEHQVSLSDMANSLGDLFEAMEDVGWDTSSLMC